MVSRTRASSTGQAETSTYSYDLFTLDVASVTDPLAGGYVHSLAALSDGTMRGWGRNAEGELGDGTTTVRATPVTVNGLSGIQPGTKTTYTYNGDGLRATRTSGQTTQTFAWDLATLVPLLLTDGTSDYLYDDQGLPVEQVNAAGTSYYSHDQYGSTRLLTDSTGAVTATFSYTPYGALDGKTGTGDTPLRWNGQYQDTDTGLYYLRARYYDPTTAQFLTRDPLAALTQQTYGYAGDNPLTWSDPSGQCWPSFACGVENAVSGAAQDVGSFVVHHPWETAGIVLGGAAALTGVGALIEVGAGTTIGIAGISFTGTQLLLGTSAVAGVGAGLLDMPGCLDGEAAACVGAGLGTFGGLAALPELFLADGLEETSLGYAGVKALSAFGLQFGLAGTAVDLSTYLSKFSESLGEPSCPT